MAKERIEYVNYRWRNEPDVEEAYEGYVVILNDSERYDELVADGDFDDRIFFYFQDEAEFQRAFDPNNTEFEFVLSREEE